MSEWAEMLREQAREALPPVEGEIRVRGLNGPVEVIRDRWGVPHIYAGSLDDLFRAQGYVTAGDRLFQMDFMLRLAGGRLAELISGMALPLDRFFRTVGLSRAGRRSAERYDERSRAMVDAFIAGANAWIESMPAPPPEYRVLDLEPEPLPSGGEGRAYLAASGAFVAWILSANWDAELLRTQVADAIGVEGVAALFPDASTEAVAWVAGRSGGGPTAGRRSALEILRGAPLTPKGQGSNNWVVAGHRTVTGKPLLANDPHLAVQLPAIWYECHLAAPGYEASGVSLPTAPGILIGHTAHHAWGFTNLGGDAQDLYLERLNEEGTAALYDGEWEPLTVHREEILVRGSEPVLLEVRETRHGPILDSYMVGVTPPQVVEGGITETYALRWVGHERTLPIATLVDLATAASFGQFREALRVWACPGQNAVYADVGGTIGYQCTGLHPVRRRGDGTIPVPGWTGDYEWDGYIPFEDLPWSENPGEGFLATANQKIHDDGYPHLITKDFMPPFRARRIVEMITATEHHSVDTFARMHRDTVSLPAREIVPLLLEVEPADDRQKEAMSHLDGWDADLAADSVAATIYEVWCQRIAGELLERKLGSELFTHYFGRRQWSNGFHYLVLPTLLRYPTATWFGANGRPARDAAIRRALGAALEELTAALGQDMARWRWGALHKVRFAGQLALIPDLAELFTAGVVEVGGDEQTVNQGQFEPGYSYDAVVIASWRHIIDLSDIDASVGVIPTGQSGNPASPHFNDQVELWSRGQYHPLPFTRRAVQEHAASTLRLLPR